MCISSCAECVATNRGSSCKLSEAATEPASPISPNDFAAIDPRSGASPSGRRLLARRIGLTLIELVVVMVILSALASLIIPRLGFMQEQAVAISGAAGAEGLTSNLETYHTSTGFYPQGFDSLLTAGGAGLIGQLIQGPTGTPPVMPFTVGSIATDPMAMASFGQAFGPASVGGAAPVYRVFDQDAAYATSGEDISSSFNTYRELYSTGAVAIVPQTATGQAIWQAAFPGVVTSAGTNYPTGVTLIAFGVGPQCNAVGSTMASAPLQSGQIPGYYARYFAIFALYGTGYGPNGTGSYAGKAAELKLVLDSNYNTIGTNISLFREAAPVDQ